MKLIKELLGGVLLFEFPSFGDQRGSFAVPFRSIDAAEAGLPETFVQDNHSVSGPVGTLRGLHLQLPPHEQGKLIRVLRGAIFDAMVDLRPESPTWGRHCSVELAATDNRVLWVPPGFAHGFCTLEPNTEVFYKVDQHYRPEAERSLAWDDPTVAVDWPVDAASVLLSGKDAAGQDLASIMADIHEASTGEASTGEASKESVVVSNERNAR